MIGGATQSTYKTGKNEGGNFSVIITALGCSDTSALTVIKRLALPTATITPLGDLDICFTGSVILKANRGSGNTFQWKKGANILVGETNKKYTATKKGTYSVIVTNTSNCSKTSDEINVTKSCKVSSMLKVTSSLRIQPNPATNAVIIQFNLSRTSLIAIKIFDLNGNEISSVVNENYEAGEHSFQINTATFAKGIYLVQMISADGVQNQKLVLQ